MSWKEFLKPDRKKILVTIVLGGIIASLTVLVMKIGVLALGRSLLGENFLAALGIVLGLFWNYFAYSHFVWKSQKDK